MLKYLLPSLLLLANAIYPLKAGDLPLKIADIDPVVGVELETAIRSGWESSLVISPKFEKAMIALTGSAVFNGEKPNSIVKVLKRFYALLQKGAPEAEALSLADMAFSDRISDDQWLNGAIALKKGTAANLPEAVLVEVVSHAINE
ncbi:MAG: hypothetical protein JNL74_05710, partial [Fibrobacteres bacterium]|nr:hypothetical protein [Fibrobacterota bacterium]